MAHLQITSGDQKGRKYDIDRDEIIIGRAQGNVVSLDEAAISGEHCSITRKGRKFILRDLESTNGTRLNGVNITEHQLSEKDVISVGAVDIKIDGNDIDPYRDPTYREPDTQVTVRMETSAKSTPVGTKSIGFATKKDNRKTWFVVVGLVVLLAIGAMGWFLTRLLGS
jgi:pSer/pThr/pTyr-binding forkhead associated (FHA) protein